MDSNNYKAPEDLKVSNYFKQTAAKDWSFSSYYHYADNSGNFRIRKMDFLNDLSKIVNSSPDLNSLVGRLRKEAKEIKNEPTKPQPPTLNVNGNNNQIISSAHNSFISNNKRDFEDLELFPLLPYKHQKTNSQTKNQEPENDEGDEDEQQELLEAASFDITRDFVAECVYLEDVVIDRFNYSKPFQQFKINSYGFLKNAHDQGEVMYLEEQFYKICAMSHTLVLKHGQYPQQALKSFGLQNLLKLHEYIENQAFLNNDVVITNELFDNMKNMIQNLDFTNKKSMDDSFFEFEKYNREKMTSADHLIYSSVKQMALNLPVGQFIKPINEMDLKANYINPFLQVFINKNTHLLKWPEINPKERSNRTSRKKRPDAIIYNINQAMLGDEMSFGEVKSIESQNKTRSLCLDLYRILHFSKDIVDSSFNQALSWQCVGQKITFYLYTLLGDSFYVMAELFNVQVPIHPREIINLSIMDYQHLCTIQHLLDHSIPLVTPVSWKRVSLETPDFSELVANRTSEKNNNVILF